MGVLREQIRRVSLLVVILLTIPTDKQSPLLVLVAKPR
jgi:hypothetical protein